MTRLVSQARMSQKIAACFITAALISGIFFPSVETVHAATAATTEASQTGFVDTVGHPDELHITKLAALGIVAGYGDGLFGPEDPVTREQFAKMLVLSAGIEIDRKPPA